MSTRQVVAGMRFSEQDDGDGFVEIRIRMAKPQFPGDNRCDLSGNDARKRFIKWVLATASGLCGNVPGSDGDLKFYGVAMVHLASADAEVKQWEGQS